MESILHLPLSGAVVVFAILALFVLSLFLLFAAYGRYKHLQNAVQLADRGDPFVSALVADYAAAYRDYGKDTNTPAIITNAVCARLSKLLFFERFMNNAVSLFVTLGLFGTFLGLSLSVSSLTELINLSSTEEWLGILNSVGGGLVSALSGMGVAFYTSLVGVACAIFFTVLRTIVNPQVQREKLETMAELWLDHAIAPTLETNYAADDESRLMQLKDELRAHAAAVEKSLNACALGIDRTLSTATKSLGAMIEYSKEPIGAFYETVNHFNENVRDFSTINYDLRGNIERMDVAFRDFSTALKQTERGVAARERASGGQKQ